jgi:hypothetical protein
MSPSRLTNLEMSMSKPCFFEVNKIRVTLRSERKQEERVAHETRYFFEAKIGHAASNKDNNNSSSIYGSLPAVSLLEQRSKQENFLKSRHCIHSTVFVSGDENNSKSVTDLNETIAHEAENSKKMVRFADSFGFDLEKVKFITNKSYEWTPVVVDDKDDSLGNETKPVISKPFLVLIPLFGLKKTIFDSSLIIKLDEHKYDYENGIIKCIVKVKNVSFEKKIIARISFNSWQSFYDLEAIYVRSDEHKVFDYFGFCIVIPMTSKQITRIEFALCYTTLDGRGQTYWDNNGGENYKFQCFFNKGN